VQERSERVTKRLERPMLVAALLVVPVLVIEQSDFGQPWDSIGLVLNYAIWFAFLAEIIVMLSVVGDRRRWLIDHPLEVFIVVLTPPFVTSALASFRLLRLLRLIRLLRLAKIARQVTSAEGVRLVATFAFLTIVAGGAGFASVEQGQSFTDGIYWAVTTMTTVGYGDLSPHTGAGKIIAVVVMLVGIGFVAVLTAAVAERFLASDIEADLAEPLFNDAAILHEIRGMSERLKRLEHSLQQRADGDP